MKKCLFILCMFFFFILAKAQDNVGNYGCIAIKQTFYGIGDGKHEPILKKSTIYVKKDNKDVTLVESDKNNYYVTKVVATAIGDISTGYEILHGDEKITDAIYVKSTIENMKNDDSQTFEFPIESLTPGTRTMISKSASDPYHNWFNDVLSGGKRNSFFCPNNFS